MIRIYGTVGKFDGFFQRVDRQTDQHGSENFLFIGSVVFVHIVQDSRTHEVALLQSLWDFYSFQEKHPYQKIVVTKGCKMGTEGYLCHPAAAGLRRPHLAGSATRPSSLIPEKSKVLLDE